MPSQRRIEHLAPWLGMLGAGAGWFVSQQLGSNAAFDDCRTGDAGFVLLAGLLGIALAGAGGYFSWDVWRRDESDARRFIGLVGLLLALIAAFAILLQSVSGLILPDCLA
jgi:hypothetical protein